MARGKNNRTKLAPIQLVREQRAGTEYSYYPLGEYVVSAPGVCGGRPTFKYTRLEVSVILSLLASGETIPQVIKAYSSSRITPEAVAEAIRLADKALLGSAQTLQLA